jgi:hypothetical protein
MKQKVALLAGMACLLILSGGAASAANPHGSGNSTGQPSQSCQMTTVTPGNAASAPGSAFNPTGTAGSVYAGTQPQNSVNPNSVAQYDVACFQQTGRVP